MASGFYGLQEVTYMPLCMVAVCIPDTERTFTVPEESRTYTVPEESRTYIVPDEGRTYEVP